jgi:hypothetical protein
VTLSRPNSSRDCNVRGGMIEPCTADSALDAASFNWQVDRRCMHGSIMLTAVCRGGGIAKHGSNLIIFVDGRPYRLYLLTGCIRDREI